MSSRGAFLYSPLPLLKRQKRFGFVSLFSEEVSEEWSKVSEEWLEVSEDSSASSRRGAEELEEKRSRDDGINSSVFLFHVV